MPRLLIFAPCEKVIIGQGDNNVSLIGILQGLQVNPRPEGPSEIPANAILPMSWTIFTMWQKEAEDERIAYTQRVALISPTDRVLLESVTAFAMERDSHRIANNLIGFPIGEAGPHTLKVWLRRGDSGDWKEISSFPLLITHPTVARASSIVH